MISYKYIYIVTVISITFVFGPLIPMLFLLCLGSLCMLYLVERMAMIYSYRKPPMYDDQLNKFLLRLLALAPFLMYAPVSIWVFSNPAVFTNATEKR